MKLRRIFTTSIMIVVLLVQFLPGSVFASRPVAAVACDAAQFVADVTIPDGTTFAPGAAMVKTWRLKNVGSCTWSTSYAIVFYSGAQMGAPAVVNLPYTVAPGATVDVTVNMTAPSTAGHYRGHWMMRNAASVIFGVGPYGNYTFFIDINVGSGGGGSSSTAYDFVANICAAAWSSGAGALPCPGSDGDSRGFALALPSPKLEDGTTGPAGLLTAPQNVTDGYIQGVYPPFMVESGDHFVSIINCQYGATGCYVTFQLQYQVGSGPVYTLKSFKEKIDGMYYNLDVNLSSLAGQNVTFILKILATGSPAGDRAVWAGARIAGPGGTPPPPVSSCDKAAFVADVSVPDGTEFPGGTAFVKTWRVQNVGTCTWTTSYKYVFSGGDYLGVSASGFNLPSSVAPGGTIDLSVNMTAPISAGLFTSYWHLRNASGANFGVGASGTADFLVKINVVSAYGSAFDFVTNAGSAAWSSGAGALSFPGTDGDSRGFPLPLGSHQMEDGLTSSEGLITFPQYVTDGYIQGIFPAFAVQIGDHFESYVGCRYGGPADCYVIFRLAYQIGSGPVVSMKTAAERLDGLVYRMDVDLSSLAGQSVKFILRVESFGSPSGDRAVWSSPRIIRSGSGSGLLASTTTITGDTPDPSAPAGSVAVTVTVTGSGATPTGTVAITGADSNCNITLASGTGTCNVVFNSAGPKTLTASYGGNSTYAGSSDTEGHTVSAPGLTASLTTITLDTPDPSAPAGPVAVTVTVTGSGGTPTGSVAITGADSNCNITLASGTGTCNVIFNTVGPKTITATYGGDATFAGSSDTESHTVGGTAASVTTITSDIPDPSTTGQIVVVSVTVTGGSGTPTGTVAITGADTNCNITLSGGSGGCNVNFTSAGGKTLIATYSGDSTYATSNDTEPHTVTAIIGPNADLSITINDGLATYTPSGTTTYTVVVSNAGPDPVTGATVTVTKPTFITSWTVSCVADATAVCTAGPITTAGNITDSVNLPVGKKVTYTIVSTISGGATGNLVTTATVVNPGPVPDPNVANNSATDTDAEPSADLAITKTDGLSAWTPGSTTTYTVVVSNNGPLNVSGGTFKDNIPAQITSWSWTCVADSGATCGAGSGGAVSTNIIDSVSIPSGKKVTYTIAATLGTSVPGDLVNTATITPPVGMPDPILTNNSATDTDAGPTADLSVTKTDGSTWYTPGTTVTYTARVVNNGPFPVVGAVFTDNRQVKVTSWSWTAVPDISATCSPCSGSANPIVSVLNLPVGQGVTFTIVANIWAGAVDNLVNIANVTAPASVMDPNPANNTVTDTDTPATADLSVTKTDGLTIYPFGGTVTYTIVVANSGPQDVVGATVADNQYLPITAWSWSCVPDAGATCLIGPWSGGNFGDLVNIPSGKKVTYTVVASVDAVTGGPLTNTVSVTPPSTIKDPTLANNTAVDTDAPMTADLVVTKTDGVLKYVPGGTLIYTITVTNNGPSDVVNGFFNDVIPSQFTGWTWKCEPQLTAVCHPLVETAQGTPFTDFFTLPVGKSITYTVTGSVNIGATTPIVNTATVSLPLPGIFLDPNPGNNSATDTDTTP